ncbi:Rho GTPase-activating protein 100F [Portunus trituberculatus]|uniref:Rho GTPase-activating protein 100F n=1 Tax=Portunus trituberculatus TaxID=210409 RepID=A0A5B7HRU2_PORTR|nr:Rho GTPase-activating protein 100F [Portunus trituberculatus]
MPPNAPMTHDDLFAARLPSSPSIFTSDEYRAWMSRAPSTSAIYERIRQSHETLRTQRGGLRFTYSADNLTDKSRDSLESSESKALKRLRIRSLLVFIRPLMPGSDTCGGYDTATITQLRTQRTEMGGAENGPKM